MADPITTQPVPESQPTPPNVPAAEQAQLNPEAVAPAAPAEAKPELSTAPAVAPLTAEVKPIPLASEATLAGIGVAPAKEMAKPAPEVVVPAQEAPTPAPEVTPSAPETAPVAPETAPTASMDAEAAAALEEEKAVKEAFNEQIAAGKEIPAAAPVESNPAVDAKLTEDALIHDAIDSKQGSGPLRRMMQAIMKFAGKE